MREREDQILLMEIIAFLLLGVGVGFVVGRLIKARGEDVIISDGGKRKVASDFPTPAPDTTGCLEPVPDSIRELVRRRKHIDAIKELRQLRNIGLKEAKDEVDRLSREMGL